MNGLTTHILDTARGLPAASVTVRLEHERAGEWHGLGQAITDADGRARLVESDNPLKRGTYRLTFEVAPYFETQGVSAFYPLIQITFAIADERHYHVPLLLSPFGYSTYRGS